MSPEIFRKTHVNGSRVRSQPAAVAREAKPERPRFGPRFQVLENNLRTIIESDLEGGGAPVGAVDLRRPGYEDPESWAKGVRIMDLSASFEASEAFILDVMREACAKPLHTVEDQVAALAERLAAAEAENATFKALRGSIAEMRGELAAILELHDDLARQMRQARAVRGLGDGQQLPTLTVKPKIRPKASRRKQAPGAMDGAAAP
jgi:hypothetical protein